MRRRRYYDEDVPLDEETQQEIIEQFELEALKKHQFYKILFTLLILLPTPAFVLVSHARSLPTLALESLVSIVASAYCLYYSAPQINRLNAVLSVVVSLQAFLLLRSTWSSQDVLWLLPLTSSITSNVLERWHSEVTNEILGLKKSKFKLKGA